MSKHAFTLNNLVQGVRNLNYSVTENTSLAAKYEEVLSKFLQE